MLPLIFPSLLFGLLPRWTYTPITNEMPHDNHYHVRLKAFFLWKHSFPSYQCAFTFSSRDKAFPTYYKHKMFTRSQKVNFWWLMCVECGARTMWFLFGCYVVNISKDCTTEVMSYLEFCYTTFSAFVYFLPLLKFKASTQQRSAHASVYYLCCMIRPFLKTTWIDSVIVL